jgi:NAD(P)-dependent dehydrogenase (short-subunit alcohol dehydrogenase family)
MQKKSDKQIQKVLITGANKGFGRALLNIYAINGWDVFPLVRRRADATTLESLYSQRCFPIVADVGSDSVETAISEVLEKHASTLDLLINNAGNIRKHRGLDNAIPEDISAHLNVHCLGALRCTKAALPYLKNSSRPQVVNITSRWGSIASTAAGQGGIGKAIYAYKIAKCAQNMLTACLHQELKDDNIQVLSVHPGRLKTSVAPPDADINPHEAAEKLFIWLNNIDHSLICKCHDLISGGTIDW